MAVKANNEDNTTGTDPQPDTATVFAALLQEMKKIIKNITAMCNPVDSASPLGEQDQGNKKKRTKRTAMVRHRWTGR